MWRGTLGMIADYPFLGVGLNGFMPMFGRYAPVEYVRGEGLERFPDKAHNDFLNMAATQGLVGLGVYLWLLSALAVAFWRHLRNSALGTVSSRPLLLALGAAWVGYLAQSFFLFPTVDTGALFWLLMGLMVSLMLKPSGNTVWRFSLSQPLASVAQGAVVALGAVMIFLSAKPLIADVYFRQSQVALGEIHQAPSATERVGPIERSIELVRQAMAWNPNDEEYYQKAAAALLIRADLADDALERRRYLDEGLTYLDRAIMLNPQMAYLHYLRGRHLESYGPDRLLEALDSYREATELFPLYWNGNAALSQLAHDLGRLDEAIIAERQLMKIFPHSTTVGLSLGTHYLAVGRVDEAIATFENIVRFEPTNAEINYWLGEAYRRKGDKERARDYFELALSYDPNLKRAQQGLNALDEGP